MREAILIYLIMGEVGMFFSLTVANDRVESKRRELARAGHSLAACYAATMFFVIPTWPYWVMRAFR